MSTNTTTYEVNIDNLANLTDDAVALLWRAGQGNPIPVVEPSSYAFADQIGREIIQRWLLLVSPAKPIPSAEEVGIKDEELERATEAVKSALEKLDSTVSDAKDFFNFLKARAQAELLKTLSELNAKNPSFDFENSYKSVSEARELIGSLRNMGATMNFMFAANEEGAGL